jgi:hypothetical protein
MKGGSMSPNTDNINIYNPRNVNVTINEKKNIIKNKQYIVFHLTGDTDKLKKMLNNKIITFKETNRDLTKNLYWYNMPEYKQDPKLNYPMAFICYLNEKDKNKMYSFLNIPLNYSLRYVHYPKPIKPNTQRFKYEITKKINPKYPVYIISKGRWKTRKTSLALEAMDCPYKIVVEPQEYNNYAQVINPKKILILPKQYLNKNKGGIPARNFVWEHAKKNGASKHWILDDNLNGFYRWNMSAKFKINSGVVFKLVEDYVSRFKNIYQAGLQYTMFHPARQGHNVVSLNTRIYSCILIDHRCDNILNERWRGKYNEDTDLSLRILKKGKCTVLFNIFMCNKPATLTTAGGNTESIYASGSKEALLKKAESLRKQHPDVTKIVKRYNRGVHHEVNYEDFKKNDPGYLNKKIYKGMNEYNMKLVKI